jgi:amidohydrolase
MCQDPHNLLDTSPRVIYCFAQHIIAPLPLHKIGYHSGAVSAASERWEIKITGKGGHSGQPENTIDALQVGVQICNALYQIRGRNVNQMEPCALSLGVFKAGDNAPNVIAESAYIMGSVRTKRNDERERIFKQI